MSADLFAEFGFGAPSSQSQRTPRQQSANSQTNSLIPDLDTFDNAVPSGFTSITNKSASETGKVQHNSVFPNHFGDFQQPQLDNGNEVLFDVSLEQVPDDESDDWGDFETAEPPTGQSLPKSFNQNYGDINSPNVNSSYASQSSATLPGNLDLLGNLSIQDNPVLARDHLTKSPLPDHPKTQFKEPKPSRTQIPVHDEPFEEWGDFTDGPPIEPRSATTTEKASQTQPVHHTERGSPPQSMESLPSVGKVIRASSQSPASQVRPTNIPPPSILLELFPQLFDQLRQEATEAKRNMQQKGELEIVALSILCTLRTAARVVVGRTFRWKRDAILSQSMRIGPARSGKAGGMKLSTVNKNEDIKEKQEAVDVIHLWRDRAALFNSIIQAVGRRPIQVISEATRVTTATTQQGALKAPHACALCGLKRDERIPKVDENVEDSFGEWWTDHWGHTDCRQFWETNMGLLSQR